MNHSKRNGGEKDGMQILRCGLIMSKRRIESFIFIKQWFEQ